MYRNLPSLSVNCEASLVPKLTGFFYVFFFIPKKLFIIAVLKEPPEAYPGTKK